MSFIYFPILRKLKKKFKTVPKNTRVFFEDVRRLLKESFAGFEISNRL